MKIVDCFIFYNELDMLLYRLDTLFNHVDYFILVESKYTYSGKEKELYYFNNRHLFEAYNSKIVHVVVDKMPFIFPAIDYSKNEQWENEHYQRNAIKNGIDKLILHDEDVIIVSDLDEIPDDNLLSCIKNGSVHINSIYGLEQDFYYYNLNTKMSSRWDASKICSFKIYKEINLSFQDIRCLSTQPIHKGGWHLSYFGDKHFIQNKIQNFSHQEYNNDKYTDLNLIEARVNNQVDLYNRSGENPIRIPISDNEYLPTNYKKHLSKFVLY